LSSVKNLEPSENCDFKFVLLLLLKDKIVCGKNWNFKIFFDVYELFGDELFIFL
jgi:hypothetical protein